MNYQNTRDILNRYFESIKPVDDIREYIKKISDYVNYIESNSFLRIQIKKLNIESKSLYQVFCFKEKLLEKSLDNFIHYLKSKLPSDLKALNIDQVWDSIDKMQKGAISSSQPKVEFLLTQIYELLFKLGELKRKEYFGDSIKYENNKIILPIEDDITRYYSAKSSYTENRLKKIWGCWDFIYLIPRADSFLYTENFEGFSEGINTEDRELFYFYIDLFHLVRKPDAAKNVQFERKIKDMLDRLHLFLLRQIDEAVDAKFWTKRGFQNFLNSPTDIASFVINIILILITALITYFVGQL